MAKRRALLACLIAEEEEEEEYITILSKLKRRETNSIYSSRDTEGFQNILVERHLLKNDDAFRKFYRLNIQQFD